VAGVGAQARAAGSAPQAATITADVIVVGAGGAALSAAIAARRQNASVVILEKGAAPGGTTAKSGGGCWVPNNHCLRANGDADPKQEALPFMLSTAWPTRFRANQPRYGLEEEYALAEAFYENAAPTFEALERDGIVEWVAMEFGNYSDHSPYGRSRFRTLFPKAATGQRTGGQTLIRLLRDGCEKAGASILTRHAVKDVILGDDGAVVGVTGEADGKPFTARARRGVVFATGGFSQNAKLMKRYVTPGLRSGCASPNAQGDFVHIATRLGAQFGNMFSGWKTQVVIEDMARQGAVPDGVWVPPGDSTLLLNKFGRRVVNEKRDYNDRVHVHAVFDPTEQEYPNFLLFMVYDQRTAELQGGNYPLPTEPTAASYVITAPDLPSLARAVQARLMGIEAYVGPISLSADFVDAARAQIERFNQDTSNRAPDQFDRDKYPFDVPADKILNPPKTGTRWTDAARFGTRHPIDLGGPLYCIILGGAFMDSNGGPVIDAGARVLHVDGHPIPGLYGAGNCIASPAGQTYWGPGGTLGPAITFGAIAGREAARRTA
jgi:succinate dehydrogenase/fumarate reductase flavoprotein subunit